MMGWDGALKIDLGLSIQYFFFVVKILFAEVHTDSDDACGVVCQVAFPLELGTELVAGIGRLAVWLGSDPQCASPGVPEKLLRSITLASRAIAPQHDLQCFGGFYTGTDAPKLD